MSRKTTIGLLPFYLKLYDELLPDCREHFAGFLADIAAAFESRCITVQTAPICCVAEEFEAAVSQFEAAQVDCLVTLHLAYSPSLESINTMCRTDLPIVILDTTMDAAFGVDVDPDQIMFNHGVHGVMDFASMLRRRGRHFEIAAGHYLDSNVIARAADLARAAVAARSFANSRMLRIGNAFDGMGDFAVEASVLANRFGITVEQVRLAVLDTAVEAVSDAAVAAEMAADRDRYACELEADVHQRAVRVGLGLRALLESGGYGGFSINFQTFDRPDRPACTMPFLEISKAMARGVGYAGEGDVLTAALVGALARAFGEATFTEIFCPDWGGNSLFLSHMGEISPSVAADTPRVFEKPLPFIGGYSPAVLTCAVKPGPAVFVNLAPGPDDSFSLIVAPIDVLPEDGTLDPAMCDNVRAWIRPRSGDITSFLEAYARAGGTHHSALVLGDCAAAIAAFGRGNGIDVIQID